ncbi:sensor histidine kinase [Paenibacillus methanolicus]|uniref:histidine kinase n=1 Tax=Paenibacillus methanolicus TaxID=582686 RepID=A0A5S5C482_9BACL|nr:HAMP domain-containing sensor histidine kinase [Paenibacillus methanolicus]TYP73949.1 two-component system OmpR family sensor kinase [Paenibacillus methanolicus]
MSRRSLGPRSLGPRSLGPRSLGPRSLRYQLLLRSILLIAGILIVIGVMQYVFMKEFLYRNKAESLEAQLLTAPINNALGASGDWQRREGASGTVKPPAASVVAAQAVAADGESDSSAPRTADPRPNRPRFFLTDASLAYVSKDGQYTDLSAEDGLSSPRLTAEQYETVRAALESKRGKADYRLAANAEGTEQLVVFRLDGPPGRGHGGIVQMGVRTSPLSDVIIQQLVIFATLSTLALLVGAALFLPLLRRTLIPLSTVVAAVEKTDAGNLTERLPDHQGQEEIDRLSVSFNGMLGRLDHAFEAERAAKERMRQFIADASHELRTPLTSIHGFLEVLLRGTVTKPEQLRSALGSMHTESKRINKLVEDLLLLAKLDQQPQLALSRCSLSGLIREMEPQLRLLAGERDVRLDLDEPADIMADADKIKQVVLNLFHNAVQHTDVARGAIRLSIRARGAGWPTELSVSDNGPGITPEHQARLFERFYRSDSSRTRKYGGAGLGLAISRSIAEAHGGAIEVASEPGLGSTFSVLLPDATDTDRSPKD